MSVPHVTTMKQEATSTDCNNGKKKRDRFNGMTEEDVLKKTVPDLLSTNLDIIIVRCIPIVVVVYFYFSCTFLCTFSCISVYLGCILLCIFSCTPLVSLVNYTSCFFFKKNTPLYFFLCIFCCTPVFIFRYLFI